MKLFPFTIPGIPPEALGVLRNVKSYDQYCAKVNELLAKKCAFCPVTNPPNEVLFETAHWLVWRSIFPQKHQSAHFVIAHRQHLSHIRELTVDHWTDFAKMNDWVNERLGDQIPGGGLGMRFGPVEYNAASIPGHLHWNIQIPDGTGVVALWLGKTEKEIEEADIRAAIFEKLRTNQATFEQLHPAEHEAIEGRYPTLAA